MVWVKGQTLFFSIWLSNCSSTSYWRDYSFSLEWCWHQCQKSTDHRYDVYFWALNSMPLICIHTCIRLLYYFNYCSLVVSFNTEKIILPTSFFFNTFGYLDSSFRRVNVRISYSISAEKVGILILIALNLYITLRFIAILRRLRLPIHEYRIYFNLFRSFISFSNIL